MIILSTTSDALQVVLDGNITTNQLSCLAVYRERTDTTFSPSKTVANTNNTTDVDLVAAPASGAQRIIDYISVFNRDTVSQTVTIKYDVGGTEYTIFRVTLSTGEKLEYQEGVGWKVYTNAGAVKNSINQGNNPTGSTINTVVLGSDQTNNNAVANTIQDCTGLSFPVVATKKYWFRAVIQYTAAATTTGSRWTINGPATTAMRFTSRYSLTTTSETNNQGLSAYDTPAASNATSAATGSNQAIVEGFIEPSADGTVIIRFASEVTASAIVAKAGSILQWQEVL